MNTTRFLLASKSMILTPSMALPVSRTLSLSLRPLLKFSNPIKIFPTQRCNYSSSCLLSARAVYNSPLVAAKRITIRCKVTRSRSGEYSPLSDSQHPGAQWGSRPPSEMGPLFPGCDYEHWLIVMEPLNGGKATKEEQIDYYIKTLEKVVGSEEAAKKAIYNVSFERYYGFGCEIDEETSNKLEGLPGVNFVLPDSYVDVENKDYGATLLVDGKIVERSPERQRRVTPPPQQSSSRPRYNDRSRYVRRRENQSQGTWQRENQTQGSFQRENQGPGMLQRDNQGPGMSQLENQGPGMWQRENQGPGR